MRTWVEVAVGVVFVGILFFVVAPAVGVVLARLLLGYFKLLGLA